MKLLEGLEVEKGREGGYERRGTCIKYHNITH